MISKTGLLFFQALPFLPPAVFPPKTPKSPPQGEQIPGPPIARDSSEHCCERGEQPGSSRSIAEAWLADIRHWRREELVRMGYDGAEYSRPELRWTQSSFIQPQMMIEDRYFYDPAAGRYTVDRYLDDLGKRYGGIDSVLVWHTYPNIGIDNRNQYDLLRDMPGGTAGLKQMVADFHRRGGKGLFPLMLLGPGARGAPAPPPVATGEALAGRGGRRLNGHKPAEVRP